MKKPKEDFTGRRFERLKVIRYIPSQEREGYGAKKDSRVWLCQCDCGNYIKLRTTQLKEGKAKSCGCYVKELLFEQTKKNTTHGKKNTRLYSIWHGIKGRCLNETDKDYRKYGGRGIKVCKEWIDDFMNFYNWSMANGYRDDLTIDRVDNDGNYEPDNCRWITNKEQSRNRRSNTIYTYKGEGKPLSELCEICGVDYQLIHHRLKRGWSIEKAIETPRRKIKRKKE